MKIETKQEEFKPIVITLETKKEVEILFAISCRISGADKKGLRCFMDTIYDTLKGVGYNLNSEYDNCIVQDMKLK